VDAAVATPEQSTASEQPSLDPQAPAPSRRSVSAVVVPEHRRSLCASVVPTAGQCSGRLTRISYRKPLAPTRCKRDALKTSSRKGCRNHTPGRCTEFGLGLTSS